MSFVYFLQLFIYTPVREAMMTLLIKFHEKRFSSDVGYNKASPIGILMLRSAVINISFSDVPKNYSMRVELFLYSAQSNRRQWLSVNVKHEYLRSRAYKWLSLSSSGDISIKSWTIEILVLTSWIPASKNFYVKSICRNDKSSKNAIFAILGALEFWFG